MNPQDSFKWESEHGFEHKCVGCHEDTYTWGDNGLCRTDVCDKINTSIYQRNEREDYVLWKKRIGRRLSDKGGYEYFKLRETSGMMDHNVV